MCLCGGEALRLREAMCRSGAQGAFTMQSSDMESVAKEWQNINVHFLTSERCVKSTEHLPKVNGFGLFQRCSFQWYRVASMPDQCLRQSRYHPGFTSPSVSWSDCAVCLCGGEVPRLREALCRSGAQGAFTMRSPDMESMAKKLQNINVHF